MKLFWLFYATVAVCGTALLWVAVPKVAARLRGGDTPEVITVRANIPSSELADAEGGTGELPPAYYGVQLASSNREEAKWGVVAKETAHYSQSGANLGKLSPGTFFRIAGWHDSSKGTMLAFLPLQTDASTQTQLVARTSAVVLTGDPSALPKEQLERIHRYYELSGLVAARRVALNPFGQKATAAYKAYNSFIAEGKRIARLRDNAEGEERIRHEQTLATRKMQEEFLRKEHEQAQKQYKQWKSQNTEDKQLDDWTAEMETLKRKTPGVCL